MLTLAMPQSEPAAERKRSACCSRSVKIADDRPCATSFCMRIASSSDLNGIRYRIGANVSVRTISHSARATTIAGSTKFPGRSSALPPVTSAPAAGDGLRHGRLELAHGACVDQRSHQRRRLERVADPHLPVRARETLLEFGQPRVVYQHAARRGAALAGSADRAEHDRRHGEVEVGELVDDDGVVAAEFEQALAEPARHALADVAADVRRAGERHEADAPVVDEARRQVVRGIDEQLEDPGVAVALEHAVADVLHGDRAQRGLERRLPDRDVAADRGEKRVPGPHRHREVEGADHADDAERVPLLEHAVVRALGVHRRGRRACATGRPRSRRCRSSPAPRRRPRP